MDEIPSRAINELKELLAEKVRRGMEALRLYEPLAEQYRAHASNARERIVRGSNRSGKTLWAALETARAVTGRDPFAKYPARDGRCLIVGKDGREIATVIWRKLAHAGAFRMIRDKETKEWRAFRPWEEDDARRKDESKPAPPLIPPRMIKGIAWENKKLNQPARVELKTGWEIHFFSSNAKPIKGVDVDLVWFDEELIDPLWYPEMRARRFDRGGKFIWSATPEAGTDVLFELSERAAQQLKLPPPQREIEEFVTLLDDNKHFSLAEKAIFAAGLSEEQQRVKVGGEFAISSFRIYPEYSLTTHGVDWFEIPKDWCRYAAVDPGYQICAVLFAAVPPDWDKRKGVYVYDELYLPDCDAEMFGREMARKTSGQTIQAFLIDHMSGRQTQMATGETVEMHYSDALRRHKVASVATGNGFWWGYEDIEGGILAVKEWLRRQENGQPTLRVLRDAAPNLDAEMKRYRRKRDPKGRPGKPDGHAGLHLIDDLRYLAANGCSWVKPRATPKGLTGVSKALADKQKKKKGQSGAAIVLGPKGAS